MVQLTSPIKYLAPFKAEAWQVAPWRDTSKVLLLTGSAGGGKSRLAAEKLHAFCQRFPGSTCIAVRKNRAIMKNSTIAFLEKTVIGKDPNVRHLKDSFRFEYANGSVLAYAGMDDEDQREHFKSIGQDGGVDLIWFEEANAFSLRDFDVAKSRLRGKAGTFRQIILTTNPDSPLHWIYTELILKKKSTVFYSSAKDNPYNPEDYLDTLKDLSGIEKLRLNDGRWVQATGLVYGEEWRDDLDNFNDSNVTYEAEYNPALDVYWTVDNGYSGKEDDNGDFTEDSHPLTILFYHLLDGDILIFDELYKIKMQPEEVIREALETKPSPNNPYPKPKQAIVDRSAAALKDRLYDDFYIYYINSKDSVDEGIKKTRSLIKPDKNGHRRVKVHPRCVHLRKEFVSYIYGKDGKPKKAFDHGPDIVRYACVEHS